MTGMKEWRLQHSRATLSEMETALDERLARQRARMLEDMALASEVADLSKCRGGRDPLARIAVHGWGLVVNRSAVYKRRAGKRSPWSAVMESALPVRQVF